MSNKPMDDLENTFREAEGAASSDMHGIWSKLKGRLHEFATDAGCDFDYDEYGTHVSCPAKASKVLATSVNAYLKALESEAGQIKNAARTWLEKVVGK